MPRKPRNFQKRFWPQQKPGFSQKPGFLGVRVDWMSVLAEPRNPVGKKPGFFCWQKTGFQIGCRF